MFIVALILFVGGIVLLGVSFSTVVAPLLFIVGILCVAAAIAIPVHLGNR